MNETRVVHKSVKLHAGVSQVWEALTNPELTKKYFFNCEAISEWRLGSPILFRMSQDGEDVVAVKGVVTSIQPNARLKYTCFDPKFENDRSKHTTVDIVLSSETDGTTLNLTQGKFADEETYRHTEASWDTVLSGLKSVVETQG